MVNFQESFGNFAIVFSSVVVYMGRYFLDLVDEELRVHLPEVLDYHYRFALRAGARSQVASKALKVQGDVQKQKLRQNLHPVHVSDTS